MRQACNEVFHILDGCHRVVIGLVARISKDDWSHNLFIGRKPEKSYWSDSKFSLPSMSRCFARLPARDTICLIAITENLK